MYQLILSANMFNSLAFLKRQLTCCCMSDRFHVCKYSVHWRHLVGTSAVVDWLVRIAICPMKLMLVMYVLLATYFMWFQRYSHMFIKYPTFPCPYNSTLPWFGVTKDITATFDVRKLTELLKSASLSLRQTNRKPAAALCSVYSMYCPDVIRSCKCCSELNTVFFSNYL